MDLTLADDLAGAAVKRSVAWLDARNGRDDHQVTLRILKVSEEAGEVAAAWYGALGNNPRKGITHTRHEVAMELADVALAAFVAIESFGFNAAAVLEECSAKVASRLDPIEAQEVTAARTGSPEEPRSLP
jgi:NTP pyrophosphatase (non-canonical NTP hydrolase)